MLKLEKMMITLVVGSLILGLSGCGQANLDKQTQSVKKQEAKVSDQAKQQQAVPQYQSINSTTKKRYDGEKTIYVLINQQDLSNDSFKKDIKAIVKDLVEKNGEKISIEFHDKKESLDISYKQYGDLSLGRPRTKEEDNLVAIHYIATFQGEMKNGKFFNTLSFFPLAGDNKTVEKLVENITNGPFRIHEERQAYK